MKQGIGAQLFTILIHSESLRRHVASEELVVLSVALHVEIVLLFSFVCILRLDSRNETLNFFMLWHGILFLLQAHHFLDHLKACKLLLRLFRDNFTEFVQFCVRFLLNQAFPKPSIVKLFTTFM